MQAPGYQLQPGDFVLVTSFDRTAWAAEYGSTDPELRPSSDSPLLVAALSHGGTEYGWAEAPRVVLHGHALADGEGGAQPYFTRGGEGERLNSEQQSYWGGGGKGAERGGPNSGRPRAWEATRLLLRLGQFKAQTRGSPRHSLLAWTVTLGIMQQRWQRSGMGVAVCAMLHTWFIMRSSRAPPITRKPPTWLEDQGRAQPLIRAVPNPVFRSALLSLHHVLLHLPYTGLSYASRLGLPISAHATLFSTPEDLAELEALFRSHPYPQHRCYIRRGHGGCSEAAALDCGLRFAVTGTASQRAHMPCATCP